MIGCKGNCVLKFGAKGSSGRFPLLLLGWKKCQLCGVFLKWDGRWCPCCSMKLSMRSNKRTRKEINEAIA